jgi:hypothetical protein
LVASVLLCAAWQARAQVGNPFAPDQSSAEPHESSSGSADKPSQPPPLTIPVEPLGFSAPGPIYLGERFSFVSLDFLDENRLLFTFRVPGLLRRDAGDDAESEERHIRAVVLTLPAGRVEAEALWTLHDRARYLWMLKDGHFLLRDRDGLQQGDASLELKPLLQFPGPLLWLEPDPSGQFLVTNSQEPAAATAKPTTQGDLVVRILRRETGQVMLVSRSRAAAYLPINAEGYLESQRGNGMEWTLKMNYFSGGSSVMGRVDSACPPTYDFVSEREVLVTPCGPGGRCKLVAMAANGRRLWEDPASAAAVWPLVVRAPDGSRLARETLAVSHSVDAYSPIDMEEIKGQMIEIFNAADGKVALQTQASPMLDAGGNVAISPSGRRVAVLNAGAIQVFDLTAPPPLPQDLGSQSTH